MNAVLATTDIFTGEIVQSCYLSHVKIIRGTRIFFSIQLAPMPATTFGLNRGLLEYINEDFMNLFFKSYTI